MAEREGPAAVGGPMRKTHDHRFVGVDVPLAEDFVTPEERELIKARLRSSKRQKVEKDW